MGSLKPLPRVLMMGDAGTLPLTATISFTTLSISVTKTSPLPSTATPLGNANPLPRILMVGEDSNLKVGAPLVQGASVVAKVLDQAQADKVLIFKKNRRHNYRRKRGHRQLQTVLRITDIKAA